MSPVEFDKDDLVRTCTVKYNLIRPINDKNRNFPSRCSAKVRKSPCPDTSVDSSKGRAVNAGNNDLVF